jgi:hypothetical protein
VGRCRGRGCLARLTFDPLRWTPCHASGPGGRLEISIPFQGAGNSKRGRPKRYTLEQRQALEVADCNAEVERLALHAVRLGDSMILLLICLCGTALSYFLGLRTPSAYAYGTLKGWLFALLIGAALTLIFYAFSTFGLMVSLDSLFSDF